MAAEIEWQWCRVVGLAQRYVPAHVAQHYCNPDESFAPPTPKFNKPKFTRILQFDDRSLNFSKSHWFSPEVASAQAFSGDFGILRGPLSMPRRQTWGSSSDDSHRVSVSRDLSALTALCQVRTKDLEPLKERLKSPLQKPKVESVSSCVIF